MDYLDDARPAVAFGDTATKFNSGRIERDRRWYTAPNIVSELRSWQMRVNRQADDQANLGGSSCREVIMLRTISSISACLALVSQVANGDEIRRTAFADGLVGTWALTAQQCEAGDKQSLVISKAKYVYGDDSCSVGWIVETAAAAGSNYAVHALCADASQPAKTKTVNLIIRPGGNDRILVGTAFDDLKPFQRCPTR